MFLGQDPRRETVRSYLAACLYAPYVPPTGRPDNKVTYTVDMLRVIREKYTASSYGKYLTGDKPEQVLFWIKEAYLYLYPKETVEVFSAVDSSGVRRNLVRHSATTRPIAIITDSIVSVDEATMFPPAELQKGVLERVKKQNGAERIQ
eukprot:GHVR01110463.1.p1 GENE.GHVR01110463.1~~GHVR01110463.1.p1  ORF type:complete len:148 (+),score=11.95 GHVR01110463.1:500-943(+)